MWKSFLFSLFISLLAVCVPSAALAFLVQPLVGSYIGAFFSFAVIIWSSIVWYREFQRKKLEIAEAEILAKQEAEDVRNLVMIKCPCNKNTFPMLIFPGEETSYVCDVCKNRFNIDIQIEPILQTDPINLDNAYKVFQDLLDKEAAKKSMPEPE